MSIAYQIEPWSQMQPEFAVLCVRHWNEIAHNKSLIPLDPDWDRYAAFAQMGLLTIATARHEGALVGYQIYIVMPHLHYKQSLTAMSDVVYLAPEHRKGRAGIRLMDCAEDELKRIGVQRVMQNVKFTNDWGSILERKGYKPFEKIYAKILAG